MVDQKCFLVKLEIYWQTFNETASCHWFVQQAEFYQCPCIPRLNIFFLQTPESQEKYFISETFQLQPYSSSSLSLWLCHNAMKYWKWHSLCVWCRLGTCLQNQSYFLPHDWSIALYSGFSCWLWNSWTFYEVSVTLLIFSYIFHTNRRDCISIVRLMIYDHTSCQIL